MKRIKHIITVAVIGLAMLAQLMSPTLVHADGETTPPAAETLTETPTPEPTEAPTETPTEAPTEATPEPAVTDAAPSEVAATAEPVETSTPEPAAETTAVSAEQTVPTAETAESATPAAAAIEEEASLPQVLEQLPDDTSVVILDQNGQPMPLASQDAAEAVIQGDPVWCPGDITTAPTPGSNGCSSSFTSLLELTTSGFIPTGNGTIWIQQGTDASPSPVAIDGNGTWAPAKTFSLTLQGGWNGTSGSTATPGTSTFNTAIQIYNWVGNVTVNDLIFEPAAGAASVQGTALYVNTAGEATVNNIKTRNSNAHGAVLEGGSRVTVGGTNEFNNSAWSGLVAVSDGPVNLNDVTANANANHGIWVESHGSSVTLNKIVTNDNPFNSLVIVNTAGDINLSNITSMSTTPPAADGTYSSGDGAYIDNPAGTGNVTLTGINNFSNHNPWNSGMYIVANGDVFLSGITSNNSGRGVNISRAANVTVTDSTFSNNGLTNGLEGLFITNVKSVTLDNVMSSNNGNGIQVSTSGSITGNNVTATGNLYRGADLFAQGNVILGGTNIFTGNKSNSSSIGLQVTTPMDVTLNNVTATDNHYGIWLQVNNAFLNGINASRNTRDGIVVFAQDITMNNVAANNNAVWGAYLWGNGKVTLGGSNAFSANAWRGLEITAGDITLNGTTAVNNTGGDRGLSLRSNGPITLNNVTADSNTRGLVIDRSGDVTLKNVSASGNQTGAEISNVGHVNMTGGVFSDNEIGLSVICAASLNFFLPLPTFTLNLTDILIDPTCPIEVNKEELPVITMLETQVEGEQFVLDCAKARSRFVVHLANGDRGDINCPVVGNATITRVDNTTLPATLPAGYTYASGFNMNIQREDEDVIVISEGGYVTASFVASSNQLQPGNSYSILYWDPVGSTWVPLKDYLLNEYRNTQVFDLFPGVADDHRKILSGVKYFTEAGEERGEVSTNFPGIFVLAQH